MLGITQEIALFSPNLGTMAGRIRDAVVGFLVASHIRRVVAGLSDAQLYDMGVDRARVLGNQPMIAVDAGTQITLLSHR